MSFVTILLLVDLPIHIILFPFHTVSYTITLMVIYLVTLSSLRKQKMKKKSTLNNWVLFLAIQFCK